MTYIIVAFATVLLNNVFLTLFSFKVRVLFGYAISMTTLIFVALCEVAWHMFNEKTAYSVNLVAVSLTAIGCTGNCLIYISLIIKKKNIIVKTLFIFVFTQFNNQVSMDLRACFQKSIHKLLWQGRVCYINVHTYI